MKKFPIVFSMDHNYVMPTCVAIHSLLINTEEETIFDIYVIIDPNVNDTDKDLLRHQVKKDHPLSEINFLEIGDTFESGYEIREISRACYNRLMIPWLLPQYDKIVYSDVDVIFRNSITDVFDIDITDYFVAGVGGMVWTKGIVNKYLKKIGADYDNYINSGFLLINASLQREEQLKGKYLELSKKKFIYQDQDIINLVCKGRIKKLPGTYNVSPSEAYLLPAEEVKMIHYFGFKPWTHFTYSWDLWWDSYRTAMVFNGEYAKKISERILKWDAVLTTKKKEIHQKIRFLQLYLKVN